MSLETVHLDRLRAHIKVTGDLDVATGPILASTLRSHLEGGRRLLRLDMAGVDFIDAAALSGIAAVHQEALERRGTLVLVGVSERIGRVLALVDLDKVLFVFRSRVVHSPAHQTVE